jgi:hypothetical protein
LLKNIEILSTCHPRRIAADHPAAAEAAAATIAIWHRHLKMNMR